jgi:hypothetical protein
VEHTQAVEQAVLAVQVQLQVYQARQLPMLAAVVVV